jgi:hypothetical protein
VLPVQHAHTLDAHPGLRYKQKGTPAGGYLRRTKGVLMAVMNCNIILDFTECFGSESLSGGTGPEVAAARFMHDLSTVRAGQVTFFLLQLLELSPTLLGELVALVYDDMCHLRRCVWLECGGSARGILSHLGDCVAIYRVLAGFSSCEKAQVRRTVASSKSGWL